MKSINYINKPSYATNLGKGTFAAAQPTYQCKKCGAVAYTPSQPSARDFGGCGGVKNEPHIWVKC